MLLGAAAALVLAATPAAAEVSSVDAYGGQAQVLGKPVRHRVEVHGTTRAQGSNQARPPTGLGSSSAAGSGSATGSAAGAGGTKGGAGGGMGRGAGASGGSSNASGSAGGGHGSAIVATEVADRSDGSLSLSGLDVLLLVAILVGLLGVSVLIRHLARQTE
jgi:hypothetical protein